MNKTFLILAAAAAVLAGCATGPETSSAPRRGEGRPAGAQNVSQATPYEGIWNSVLGYHGPANAVAAAGGPQ